MAKVTVMTYLGEQWAAGRLVGTEATTGKFIGWGTGEGTAAKGRTSLFIESAETRAEAPPPTLEGTGVAAKYQVEGTLASVTDQTITNAGTFTALVNGRLILHVSHDPIDLNAGDEITYTFTINP